MFRVLAILVTVLPGAAIPVAAQGSDDASAIRDARLRSNAAIAAQDVAGIVAEVDTAFQVTAGSGRFLQGREAMREAFEEQFSRFPDAVYVRTPDTVEVGEIGTRGFENGTWVGTWTTPEGPLRTGGRYSAYWTRSADSWKIRSELFVTLFCEGVGCD